MCRRAPWLGGATRALVAALAIAGTSPVGTGAQGLDALKTPPSPGFAILGLSPSAIERPTTPKALALGLVSATERGTVIPGSYAVEFTPYWLTPKPFLTFSQRYRPSFWQGVKQSFAVSIATDRGTDTGDSTRLGIGARVQLLSGRPSLRTEAARDSLAALLHTIRTLRDTLRAATSAAESARLRARIDTLEVRERILRVDFQGRQWSDRDGVRWELAGAVASSFPSNTFADGDVTAWGVWSTLSCRPTAQSLDLLVLLRYQQLEASSQAGEGGAEVGTEAQQVLDAGVRLLYGSGPLSVSGELLGRTAFDVSDGEDGAVLIRYDNSYRLTASVEYRLSDLAALEWTFGRGFALAGADGGELVSLLGLKWAMGQGLELPLR